MATATAAALDVSTSETDRTAAVALGLGALVMTGLSLAGIFGPADLVAPMGITLPGPAAFNEIRVGYGSHLALAIFFAYAVARPSARGLALALLALEFGNIVVVRLLGFVLDGAPGPAVYKPMVLEVVMLGLAVAGILARRSSR